MRTIYIDQDVNCQRKKKKNVGKLHIKRKNRFFKCLVWSIFLSVGILAGLAFYYSIPVFHTFRELTVLTDAALAGRYNQLRTAPYVLHPGTDLAAADFLSRLEELGYERQDTETIDKNQYFVDGKWFFLNIPPNEKNVSQNVRMELEGGVVLSIVDLATGKYMPQVELPAITLTWFMDRIWEIRIPKTYEELPEDLIRAVLATEDQNFFQHPGFDFPGILRAAYVNLKAGKVVQGGSTISQQLVKVMLNRQDRSFAKKYEEALLAMAFEYRYTKEDILTLYLNNVYLGRATPFEIRGMAAAANYILDKDLDELDIKDCAMLAGLVRSPNSASPLRNPKAAAIRTKTVLKQMAEQGDPLAAWTHVGGRLKRIRHHTLLDQQSWFFDQLEKDLKKKRILPHTRSLGMLKINTTLDPWVQADAYASMTAQLTGKSVQGALVMMVPQTGEVRAMVGGKNYRQSPFNRAVYAKRQIGSLVKPFVYLAALGGDGVHSEMTQATMLNDKSLTIRRGRQVWRPNNYDRKFKGMMTARRALATSRNIPAIKVGQRVGIVNVRSLLKEIGVADTVPSGPAIFLGAIESTPIRMAAAFSGIANGGKVVIPQLINRVLQGTDEIYSLIPPKAILAPAPCFVMTDMLQEVFLSGTARKAQKMGFVQSASGKTGTTNKLRDSWFAGYTPSLVSVAWVGRDDNKSCGLTGSSGALPLWVSSMRKIVGDGKSESFPVPKTVEFANIDKRNGKQTAITRNNSTRMAFVEGTVPRQYSQALDKELIAIKAGLHKTFPPRSQKKSRIGDKQSWLVSKWEQTLDWFND